MFSPLLPRAAFPTASSLCAFSTDLFFQRNRCNLSEPIVRLLFNCDIVRVLPLSTVTSVMHYKRYKIITGVTLKLALALIDQLCQLKVFIELTPPLVFVHSLLTSSFSEISATLVSPLGTCKIFKKFKM